MPRLLLVRQIKQLYSRDFLRHNLIFFIGTLIISIFNYMYYPVLGRLVSVSDFGEIQASISIFMQLGIVLTAFGYVVTNIINNNDTQSTNINLIMRLEKLTLYLCLSIFIILCIFSVFLKSKLQFTSFVPFVLVGVLVILTVVSTSRTYLLQGLKRLKEVSLAGILYAVGKLLISILLVLVINSVIGALIGYVCAILLTLIYLSNRTKHIFPTYKSSLTLRYKFKPIPSQKLKEEIMYGIAILVLLSGLTFLYTSDAVIVRLFFSAHMSGIYSAISAIARIIFFTTASVSGVLLATVKMSNDNRKNIQLLLKSIGLVTIIGGAVAALFVLFPKYTISILFGSKYDEAAYLLPMLAILMLVCAYNNLLICYEIALRRFKSIYIVATSVVLLFLMIGLLHDSLIHIIFSYLVVNVFVLVLLSIHILRRRDHVETTAIRRSPEL